MMLTGGVGREVPRFFTVPPVAAVRRPSRTGPVDLDDAITPVDPGSGGCGGRGEAGSKSGAPIGPFGDRRFLSLLLLVAAAMVGITCASEMIPPLEEPTSEAEVVRRDPVVGGPAAPAVEAAMSCPPAIGGGGGSKGENRGEDNGPDEQLLSVYMDPFTVDVEIDDLTSHAGGGITDSSGITLAQTMSKSTITDAVETHLFDYAKEDVPYFAELCLLLTTKVRLVLMPSGCSPTSWSELSASTAW
uniref:Uncharacterized protein n=1 Tax=Trieres chinensis TaxID=1514140 RepID=A0A7S1Z3Y3_TRICV|mmetsp:Transcript_16734/g.34278  ORF Transcript_16734/g.34278 Transcript_16734/m.34278 type:complete len:245 (+) Transcript_16734:246-980(+)